MKVCLVSTHGGHLAEARLVAEGLKNKHEVFFITDADQDVGFKDKVYYVRHFVKNPLLVFVTAWRIVRILMKERPGVVVSTGAEIALPAFSVAKLLFGLPTVYVECSAQVVNPSLTGRIVYPITDLFLVQWEPLLRHYGPKARYKGGFI